VYREGSGALAIARVAQINSRCFAIAPVILLNSVALLPRIAVDIGRRAACHRLKLDMN